MRLGWVVIVAALLFGRPAWASPTSEGLKPLFAGDEVIHLTLKGPIRKLTGSSARPDQPVDASLSVVGGSPETLPVRLSVRGHTRRDQENCEFPPLRVDFLQKVQAPSLFAGQKKLKLVTHCRSAESFQQYQLLEYSAYRLYNVLTPLSFRARLAVIDYTDEDGRPITSRLGMFLEDDSDVARRNGLRPAKIGGGTIPLGDLSARDAARDAVFQYMIGNLDFSMRAPSPGAGCCHNTKLLAAEGATTGLVPTPYDFDSAGLVDPPYAAPPEGIPVGDVRTRRYRGYCLHNEEAQAAAADMLARRAALLAVYDSIPRLDPDKRRRAIAYLGGFFDQVASRAGVADHLLRTCLG